MGIEVILDQANFLSTWIAHIGPPLQLTGHYLRRGWNGKNATGRAVFALGTCRRRTDSPGPILPKSKLTAVLFGYRAATWTKPATVPCSAISLAFKFGKASA